MSATNSTFSPPPRSNLNWSPPSRTHSNEHSQRLEINFDFFTSYNNFSFIDVHKMFNSTDTSDVDLDLGHKKSSFSMSNDSIGGLKVWCQNVTFTDGAYIGSMYLGDNAHVFIHNRSSFKTLEISNKSSFHLKDCDISCDDPIENSGKLDIDGIVTLVNSTLILSQGSSFSNLGIINLVNTSKIIIPSNSIVNLTNDITSEAINVVNIDEYIMISGTAQTSPNTSINISAPMYINNDAQLIIGTDSVLTVSYVNSLAIISVEPTATLIVKNSLFSIFTNTTTFFSRKLLTTTSNPGTCVFQQSTLTGSGVLDCNVVFSGLIDLLTTPSILDVASITFDVISKVSLDITPYGYDSIISQNNVQLNGELHINFLEGYNPTTETNFTIIYSNYGVISGQFSKYSFFGTELRQSIIYTSDSVILSVAPIQSNYGAFAAGINTNVLIPSVIVGCFGLFVISMIIYKRSQKKRQMNVLRTPDLMYTVSSASFANPLNKMDV